MSFFDNLRRPVTTVLKMSNCSFCGVAQTETGICEPCLEAIDLTENSCSRCASVINNNSQVASINNIKPHKIKTNQKFSLYSPQQPPQIASKCGQCVLKPPLYQTVIAATRYKFPIDKALSELKFNKQLHYARSLSHVLERKIKDSYQNMPYPKALVAIPLHPKRLSERGFNQSELISKQLSKALGIAQTDALTRVKDTPHQIGLSEKQRRRNLNNAFYVKQSLPDHVALIDDVVTTGSTVIEATKVCLEQGVKRVDIWCLAKT